MTRQDFLNCHERIKPYIHRTPVLTSQLLNQRSEAELYFKCENFQRTGSFKMRGATNAILSLTKAQQERGVVTHSSGNFAQAVALSAKILGIKAYIVMPSNAPIIKKIAVKGYGATVTECPPTLTDRERTANAIVDRIGATLLHPSNQTEVIVGQGTAAMELLEDYPSLDYILVPVGGGGLLAGTALVTHYFSGKSRTIAGEPLMVDDAYRSLKSGQIEDNETANTIADGLRTKLGNKNFPTIQEHVESIIRVEEHEIVEAMRLIWERMKIIIEPSSAVPFAAVLKNTAQFKGKKVGTILSGGNVDLEKLPFTLFSTS